MSTWNIQHLGSALPDNSGDVEAPAEVLVAAPAQPTDSNPNKAQEHGWAPKVAYDYEAYAKSIKQLKEEQAAFTSQDPDDVGVGGLRQGQFASEAAIYEWDDEFGDIGPPHPELEKQLFGAENHVRSGKNFECIASLEVIQEGTVRINPVRKFEDAGLHPAMLDNVKLAGYDIPTPIQQYCLPAVAKGYDIVACAQTGSGKTAAFLVPILSKLMGKAKKLTAPRPNPATFQAGVNGVRGEPLVLIVCPSRELATQIFDEARRFCYRTMLRPCVVYGGGPIVEQIVSLSKGCDLLIGTPGRLVDLIVNRPQVITLKRLKYMVIDEADEMLHADWDSELKQIMSGGDQEEGNITYMMFSATFPKICRDLAKEHLAHEHVRIRVGRAGSSHTNIKQASLLTFQFWTSLTSSLFKDIVEMEPHRKHQALQDLLMSAPPCRTIIFVNSKRTCDEIDDYLFNAGFPVTAIHSDRTQREREDAIRAFRSGKCPILIATGVSARGLDVHNVLHVINYDLPRTQYGGIEEYTHRIGRTGRIGNIGLATSFFTNRDDDLGEALVKTMLETHQVIPDFLSHHIPEGFTADGAGDVTTLKFEADSDDGEDEGADAGGGGWGTVDSGERARWGATPAASQPSGWGAPAAKFEQTNVGAVSQPGSSWGAQRAIAQPAVAQPSPFRPGPAVDGWGAAPTPAQAPVATNSGVSGWGAPAPAAQTQAPANSSAGWGNGGACNSQPTTW